MSSLGTAGATGAAIGAVGTGPYAARFGTGKAAGGVSGELSASLRPAVTLSRSGAQWTITNDIEVTPGSDLGWARTISLHNADGTCIACEWLEEARYFANGVAVTIPASSITLTLE